MLQTYKATLRGNRIEWQDEQPETSENGNGIEVIVTILDKTENSEKPRPFGLSAGEFVVPDDFNAPLPEEILADFEVE